MRTICPIGWLGGLLLAATAACAAPFEVTVKDGDGSGGRVGAPVCRPVMLTVKQLALARAGRLLLIETRGGGLVGPLVPAQFEPGNSPNRGRLWWRLPPGPAGNRTFRLTESRTPPRAGMKARVDAGSGQITMDEAGRPVLRYNFRTIEPGDILKAIAQPNLIYARPRSDYIHPLYGPDGEELTKDWSVDHPHHRGIYWAWPEVDWHGERGDLHALQRVFARPVGQPILRGGPVYAEIEAENEWRWEDREPVVHERALIRAYRVTAQGRLLDLTFRFVALQDDVAIARRGTNAYGGLNIRLAAVKDQQIRFHTDPADAAPRMAWANLTGLFPGGIAPVEMIVLQSRANPDYPGDWVQFPELNWFQPTFPAVNTRYVLKKGAPLTLRFRLWIRRGGQASEATYADQWRVFNTL